MSPNSDNATRLFQCPTCGATLEVQDVPSVKCKYCGNNVPVPAQYRTTQPQVIIQQMPEVMLQSSVDYSAPYSRAARSGQRAGCIITAVILIITFGAIGLGLFASRSAITDVQNALQQSGISVQLPGAPTPTPSSANLVLEFGGKGSGAGLMDDPRYVAVDPDGNIFVGDYSDGRVQKFDPTGKFLLLMNVPPDDNDNLYIMGMVADYKGNLYLTRGGDILKYNAADGQLLTTFKGHFPDTSYDGLAVDATNTLYALHTTASDNDLITLNPDGKVLNRWNKIVTGVNKKDPGMQLQVAPDGVGNLYISSGFGNVVYVFDRNGKYVNRFGQEGHDPGQMSNPGQIAVDGQNRVYVHNFGAIDRFDTSGRFLDRLPTDYTQGSPMGFTLDLKGSLYVVTNNGKVLKYQLKGAG